MSLKDFSEEDYPMTISASSDKPIIEDEAISSEEINIGNHKYSVKIQKKGDLYTGYVEGIIDYVSASATTKEDLLKKVLKATELSLQSQTKFIEKLKSLRIYHI